MTTLAYETRTYRTVTEMQPGTVKLTGGIKQAMRDWLSGAAGWKQRWPSSPGRYVLKVKNPKVVGGTILVPAPWEAVAKKAFAGPDELHSAAHAARKAGLV